MSENERDRELSTLAKDIRAIKRWAPLVVLISGAFWAAIKLGSTAQSTYDTQIAKKEDVIALKIDILKLTAATVRLDSAFSTYKKADTSDKASIRADMKRNISIINSRFDKLSRTISFYTEKYSFDANGRRKITVIAHPN